MKRLLPFFRPFWGLLLMTAGLVFFQAYANLALPDYMARIVNVGIQQAGVERPLPRALRTRTFNHLRLFLVGEEKTRFEQAYSRVEPDSAEAAVYQSQYPLLQREPIYILRDGLSSQEQIALEHTLAPRLLLTAALERLHSHPDRARQMLPGLAQQLQQLPPGTDIWALFEQMPPQARQRLVHAIEARFQSLGGEAALRQAAARVIRAEYEALGVNMARVQAQYILRVGGEMLLVALLAVAATVAAGFFSARMAAGLAHNLRYALFQHVMAFSAAERDRFSTVSLITRATNDITQIQTTLHILARMVFFAPFMGAGALWQAVTKAPHMWWILALAVLLVVLLIAVVFALVIPRFRKIQEQIDRLTRVVRENLTGMMVVRAFNRQPYEETRFEKENQALTRLSLFVNRVFVVVSPFMMLVMNAAVVLILWVGAHQVARARIQIGDMMAFMQYAMMVVFAFMMMSMVFVLYPRADVSAHRVAEVLEQPITIVEPPKPALVPRPFVPRVEFQQVHFRYPDAEEDMLREITFQVEPGQTVGIIGTTGSGKSTLVSLIPRFYDVSRGAVLVSGLDVRAWPLQALRERIAYVPQKAMLFAGTVESNLRMAAADATEAELWEALEVAQADFILHHPKGLQAEVAQAGSNFSGGQRQRLTIARALVRRAPIYIFDDCFSALDYATEARLRQALRHFLRGSTVFIVSQRVASIMHADLILVLDEGRLVGLGTHEALLRTSEVYRDIALAQLAGTAAR